MGTQRHSFARTAVLLSLLALILGLSILAAPPAGMAQNGFAARTDFASPRLHTSFTIQAANAAAAQDAAQTAPPAPTPAQPIKVELPDGDGKAMATEFCQDCHRLTNLTKSHKSKDDWSETVQTMMDRGARLPQESVDTLVQYLAKNFPPKTDTPAPDAQAAPAAPAPAASTAAAPAQAKIVELPDGDGKAIAEENCQACHRLTNLVKAHKSLDEWHDTVQLMMDRGANIQPDQVDTLVHYLAKNFGPLPADAGTGAASSGGGAPNTSSPAQ
ncbi:MAG: cytochrome c [Acidobacteriia bacterium]|nr:cytochrome c [Terriglobia bacterium]